MGGARRGQGAVAALPPKRRRAGILLLAAAASLGWVASGAGVPSAASSPVAPAIGPVPAHSELLSVTPANGATLSQPPAQIVLVFNEDVNPSFVTVALSNAGAAIGLEAPAVSGGTVTAAVLPGAGPGSYRIAYRVVSKDGHPVSGTTEFTVGAATSSATVPTAPTAPTAPAGTAAPSVTAPAAAATTPVGVEPVAATTSIAPVLTVVAAVLALGAGVGIIIWRRRVEAG